MGARKCAVAERSVIWNAASSALRGNGGNVLTVKPGCKASGGVIRSENVDMSSDKAGEKPARRKPKVSYATFIGVG